jgi:hypothetical protein
MRLFDPRDAAARGGSCAKAGAKRSHSEMVGKSRRGVPSDDREDDDFGDGENVGDDEEMDDGSESDFITSGSRPSAENPNWSYRWRGEETREERLRWARAKRYTRSHLVDHMVLNVEAFLSDCVSRIQDISRR